MFSKENQFSTKVKLVQGSLEKLIKQFQKKPADFVYEEELRSLLYNLLREVFNENQITVSLYEDQWHKEYVGETISPIKAEYGKDSGYFSKYNISDIDLAILSEKSIDDEKVNNFQRYCDIIIEIKYSTEKLDSQYGGFVDDIQKIRNAKHNEKFLGLALCFDLHHFKDSKAENKFLRDYNLKKIDFKKIEANKINLSESKCYAMYITPKVVFLSQSLDSKQNDG